MPQQPSYRPKGTDVKQRVIALIKQNTSTAQIVARMSVSKSYVNRIRQEIESGKN